MPNTEQQIEEFLKDIAYTASYEFLEEGKDDKELSAIAEKRGIQLPSQDLSVFKARYAVTDRANRNHCILDKADVKTALDTLVGKRVTIDHMLRRVVGHFLDAKLENNVIFAYGVLFKSSFGDEYDEIKRLMTEGKAGVSFEAYGQRDSQENGNYYLRDIHFAGGAILLREEPAEPTARVLELAKLLTPPEKFLTIGKEGDMKQEDKIEFSRFYVYDFESVIRLLQEAKVGEEKLAVVDILQIDFEHNSVRVKAYTESQLKKMYDEGEEVESSIYEINLTPSSRVVESARAIVGVQLVVAETYTCPHCDQKMDKKMKTCPKCKKDTNHKEMEKSMEELEQAKKAAEEALAKLTAKDVELAEAKKAIESKDGELTTLKAKVEAFEKADRDRVIASRRAELGEFVKDMKDEDILDEHKFEVAKRDKEIAELKTKLAAVPATASVETPTLVTGASKTDDAAKAKSLRIRESAFTKDTENENQDED